MRRFVRVLAVVVVSLLVAAACGSSESAIDASGGDEELSLRFGELRSRNLDGGADGRNTTAAVAGLNEFAIDLYSTVLPDQPGNLVISPYSVSFALSMVYAGAGGETAAEMASVLHDDADDWHEGINAYDLTLDARTVGSPTTWTSANKVWVQEGLSLLDPFLDVLTGDYGSPLADANFSSDEQREIINRWVEGKTAERIPELFPAGSLSASTAMVLVNAVALDAPWEFPFDPEATRPGSFTLLDGTDVEVPMMHYDEFLPSGFTDEAVAVELPYGGGALSMVVIVPNDLEEFESTLTVETLDAVLDSIAEGGIHLTIPKWSARTHITLNKDLQALGMPSAFDPAAADFTGMTNGGGLYLDVVEHEAFIEVDEEGTRAAAATGAAMAESHGPTITVDRPFLYLIRDRGAGTILFIGRVVDPTATA